MSQDLQLIDQGYCDIYDYIWQPLEIAVIQNCYRCSIPLVNMVLKSVVECGCFPNDRIKDQDKIPFPQFCENNHLSSFPLQKYIPTNIVMNRMWWNSRRNQKHIINIILWTRLSHLFRVSHCSRVDENEADLFLCMLMLSCTERMQSLGKLLQPSRQDATLGQPDGKVSGVRGQVHNLFPGTSCMGDTNRSFKMFVTYKLLSWLHVTDSNLASRHV